jgi:hypothetical protein
MAYYYWFSKKQAAANAQLIGHGWANQEGEIEGAAYTEMTSKPIPIGCWDDYELVAVEEDSPDIVPRERLILVPPIKGSAGMPDQADSQSRPHGQSPDKRTRSYDPTA